MLMVSARIPGPVSDGSSSRLQLIPTGRFLTDQVPIRGCLSGPITMPGLLNETVERLTDINALFCGQEAFDLLSQPFQLPGH